MTRVVPVEVPGFTSDRAVFRVEGDDPQSLADTMAAVTSQLIDSIADSVEQVPSRQAVPSRPDRSAYDEYLRTGRYPINPLVSIHAARLVERSRQYLAVESAMGGER